MTKRIVLLVALYLVLVPLIALAAPAFMPGGDPPPTCDPIVGCPGGR